MTLSTWDATPLVVLHAKAIRQSSWVWWITYSIGYIS